MWYLTCSETAFVDPGVHIGALILELLKLIGGVLKLGRRVFQFQLEILDLVLIRSDGIIEGFCQWVRRRFHRWGYRTVIRVGRSRRRSLQGSVLRLACGGWAIRLKLVLRIEGARVLSVFVWWALLMIDVWEGSGRHWEILVASGWAIARQTAEPGHDMNEERDTMALRRAALKSCL